MSTNSVIIVKLGNKKYQGVYCHWDGHDESTGRTLRDNFNSKKDAVAITNLGSLSTVTNCVRVEPTAPHTFSNPQEGTIIAYHRDRQDPVLGICHAQSWKEIVNKFETVEYVYVWENNQWNTHVIP
jgi:hypothetical protein